MKSAFLPICFILFVFVACDFEKKSVEGNGGVYSQLERNDSISCYMSQWKSYYNIGEEELKMAESVYGSAFMILGDSVYRFSCLEGLVSSETFSQTGITYFFEDIGPMQRIQDGDTLYLKHEGRSLYPEDDTNTYTILDSYIRRKVSIKDIRAAIQIQRNTDCPEVFLGIDLSNWVEGTTLSDYYGKANRENRKLGPINVG